MSVFQSRVVSIGKGAEFVISGENQTTIISGGIAMSLSIVSCEDKGSNVILHDGETAHILMTGSAIEAVAYYKDIAKEIKKTGRRDTLSILRSLSIISACIVVTFLGGLFTYENYLMDQKSISVMSQPTSDEIPVLPEALKQSMENLSDTTPLPTASFEVMDKPSYLNDTSVVPEKKLSFPEYKPDFTRKIDNTIDPVSPNSVEPNEASHNMDAKDEMPQQQSSVNNQSEEVIAKNAEMAISNLINGGMDESEIKELLLNLQTLNTFGEDAITSETLQSLPEEIAALLIDKGIDVNPNSTGTMRILPSETVDQFRGPDGISSIPENYSWYARTGGTISIPLPGGGDIKTVEDMLDFGFQP